MILVSGLINLETTLQIDAFPLPYYPVTYPFFGVRSTVSGVGYNIAKALTTLGDEVQFMSIIGDDMAGNMVLQALQTDGLPTDNVLPLIKETAQSIIIYDKTGQRQIHTDLKDIQQAAYPAERFVAALGECSLAVLCNINFSRPFLQMAKSMNIPIATDVHEIDDLNDDYNQDYMAAADILFMSGTSLPTTPRKWIEQVRDRFGTEIIVIGLGERGSLLSVRRNNIIEHVPAVQTRPVVNTIGAGDALFSAFIHFYNQSMDALAALQKATVFASYKIGERGAAEGFLTELELHELMKS